LIEIRIFIRADKPFLVLAAGFGEVPGAKTVTSLLILLSVLQVVHFQLFQILSDSNHTSKAYRWQRLTNYSLVNKI
jgi:hypothetical protein